MPRETDSYRDNLERICERFPRKEMLNISDVCGFLGYGYKRAIREVPFRNNSISKASLARFMSPGKMRG